MDFSFNFTGTSDNRKNISMSEVEIYDTIVIGGGPAAITALLYLARKGVKCGYIASRVGGALLDTKGIENYPGIKETEGAELTQKMRDQIAQFEIPSAEGDSVVNIKIEEGLKVIECYSMSNYRAKTIIIASGSRWKELGIPGENQFKTRGVAYCSSCDAPFFKGKNVVVAGGGNSGLEAALELAVIAKSVTIFEYREEFSADKILIDKALKNKKIVLRSFSEIIEIMGNEKLEKIAVKNRKTQEIEELFTDGVFVEIGLLPNSDFAKNIVEINSKKEIVIDSRCRTNYEGIFAAGDVTNVPFKQIVIAAGEGAKAAMAAYEYLVHNCWENCDFE